MEAREPTVEQKRKFWEWCGIHFVNVLAYADWVDRDGNQVQHPDFIPIDHNNLFKYAVPTLCDYLTERSEWYKIRRLWEAMERALVENKPVENTLFWTIWELIIEKLGG